MSKRFFNRLNKFALFFLTIGVTLILVSFNGFAATYSIPQTTGAKLSWDHNDPLPEGYRVFQRKDGQAFDYSSPVWTGTNNSCTVYNLEYDTLYFFVVRAYEGDLESVDSDEVSFTAPTPLPTTYSISATVSGSGSISPSGATIVTEGTDQICTIIPDSGYQIADVRVDGVSQGALTEYTFAEVDGDHTITATFEAIKLSNNDSSSNDSDSISYDVSNDFSDLEDGSINILFEAEDGNVAWPMEIADDENAGAGGYIWTATEIQDFFSSSDSAGYVAYDFELRENSEYVIWIRQISNTSQSDSFFLSIDDQDPMTWHTKTGTKDKWTWDVMTIRNASDPRETSDPYRFWLAAGQHTLTIRQRESGTKLDALLITNDSVLSENAELVEEYFTYCANKNDFESANSIYNILMSSSSDRLNPVQLDGASVDDQIYVFVDPSANVKRVEFFIGDMLYQTENYAPFDLAGGASGGLAAPFDTGMLSPGLHKFSARITRTDSSSETIAANVTVAGHVLLASSSADRSDAYPLEGTTAEGDIYVFVESDPDIKRVEFFIDGMLYQTENYAPFDLAGGASGGLAAPFDTGMLSPGLHKFSARITRTDSSSETIAANVTVAGHVLLASSSADRSDAYPLEGATVSGDIYVFVESDPDIKRVEFFIDGMLYQTENYAPFDLAGGASGGLAAPFNTLKLGAGLHTISAQVTKTDGTMETTTVRVSVKN